MRLHFTALLLLCCGSIVAQDIVTDRPDQTESASTVPQGSLQIESGMVISHSNPETTSIRNFAAPSTLFRVSLLKGLELRLFHQVENIKPGSASSGISGTTDIQVGVKVELYNKKESNTEIAFLSHVILPTGSKHLTLDEYGSINKLCISHNLSDKFGLSYNLGYDNFGSGDGDLTYSLAMAVGITDKLGLFIEPYGGFAEMTDHIANADAGFTYLIKNNLQADFSFGTGINETMNFASAGISWNIKN